MSVLGATGADGHCGGSRMSRGAPRVKSGGRAGDKHGEDSAGRLQGSSGTVDTSQSVRVRWSNKSVIVYNALQCSKSNSSQATPIGQLLNVRYLAVQNLK